MFKTRTTDPLVAQQARDVVGQYALESTNPAISQEVEAVLSVERSMPGKTQRALTETILQTTDQDAAKMGLAVLKGFTELVEIARAVDSQGLGDIDNMITGKNSRITEVRSNNIERNNNIDL